ncbi:pectin lyase-like protein [Irpex rosettiformis]|uniref:Pectin lyase-like protein n=1 Tax=Irpex rosettiformis TaxID=378272 RepID=A0ACB8UM05_9APHY|nr:pectin lyase-like protein [Irpex rosettiformis]
MMKSLLCSFAFFSFASAWSTFIVPHTDGQDDIPALTSVLTAGNYTNNATILFEKGITYNIFTPIKFPFLNSVEIAIEGNLTLPNDIPTVQAAVASKSYPGAWVAFSGGNNVTLRGTTDPTWGWVDAHGQSWWDAQQQTNRPHGWAFSKITSGVIRDMKLWKPIGWCFSTSGSSNLHILNNLIVALSNTESFPFNTSTLTEASTGFSAGGTNILFENNIVQNGDDCLTVGSGAKNIHWRRVFLGILATASLILSIRNSFCEGGHGLSIGSLGSGGSVADVENVLIETTTMKNSLYAARFKSWTGGNGFARNYWDQEDGAPPNSTVTNNTHIEDFLFENFKGTIEDKPFVEGSCVTDPCWYAVPGATGKEVIIFDLYQNTATNIVAKNISAETETGAQVTVMCNTTTVSSDVGFKCWNGPYVPTKVGL